MAKKKRISQQKCESHPKGEKQHGFTLVDLPDDILYIILRMHYEGANPLIQQPGPERNHEPQYQKSVAAMLTSRAIYDMSMAILPELADFQMKMSGPADFHLKTFDSDGKKIDLHNGKQNLYNILPPVLVQRIKFITTDLTYAERFVGSWATDMYMLESLERFVVVDKMIQCRSPTTKLLETLKTVQETCNSRGITFDSRIKVLRDTTAIPLEHLEFSGRWLTLGYQGPDRCQVLQADGFLDTDYEEFRVEFDRALDCKLPVLGTFSYWSCQGAIYYP